VTLEGTGALALHDRRTGERYSDVLRLEDGGDAGDTYSYCPPTGDRLRRSTGPIAVRRLAAGPLVAALEARWVLGRQYAARLVVVLHADSPIVRCILHLDNGAGAHRLRADHVDHVQLASAADELGRVDERPSRSVRPVESDQDLHGRW